jgi:hypothetical protein
MIHAAGRSQPTQKWLLAGMMILAAACNLAGQAGRNPAPTGSAPTASPESECRPPEKAPTVQAGLVPARTESPSADVDPEDVLGWLCASNVYDRGNPAPGKTVRFAVPVAIHPHGNASVLTAIEHYQAATGGAVKFAVVSAHPPVGITIIDGDAVGSNQGEPGCGNVTSGPSPTSGHRFFIDPHGAFNTLVYVHLGSSACDDEAAGYRPESVAEHELGHALGVGEHFPGFTGDEGLSANLTAVVTMLYSLPPGTDMTDVCQAPS